MQQQIPPSTALENLFNISLYMTVSPLKFKIKYQTTVIDLPLENGDFSPFRNNRGKYTTLNLRLQEKNRIISDFLCFSVLFTRIILPVKFSISFNKMIKYFHKNGREYVYYVCQKDDRRANAACPVHRVPAEHLEKVLGCSVHRRCWHGFAMKILPEF